MAYDPAAAHEYYIKYRKKGLKKGRKKGKDKAKVKSTNLVGLSSSGLNEAGKMEAALIKDKIKKEMNAALSKAKTDEEREKIRREYQQKALDAINKLKTDSKYAQAKAAKAAKATKSSGSAKAAKTTKASTGSSKGTTKSASSEATQASIKNIEAKLDSLSAKLESLSDEQKQQVKAEVNEVITQIRSQLQLDRDKLIKSLRR